MSILCVRSVSLLFIMIDVKLFGLISTLKSVDLTTTVVSCTTFYSYIYTYFNSFSLIFNFFTVACTSCIKLSLVSLNSSRVSYRTLLSFFYYVASYS
nr:MAG TPA: hypothetical protein [Caudoviricetes sp.]